MKVKRENTMKKIPMLMSLLVIFIVAGWLCIIPTDAKATGDYQPVVITESLGGYNILNFTLISEDPLGITEFIVGNNNAARWGNTINSTNPILAGWQGHRIERNSNDIYNEDVDPFDIQWRVLDQNSDYNSSWINPYNELFQDYTMAFLWTAYNVYDNGLLVGTPLGIGSYSTFIGVIETGIMASPFMVHNIVDGSYDGETTNSIPEPLTVLLLGIGLTAIAGIKRRYKE